MPPMTSSRPGARDTWKLLLQLNSSAAICANSQAGTSDVLAPSAHFKPFGVSENLKSAEGDTDPGDLLVSSGVM